VPVAQAAIAQTARLELALLFVMASITFKRKRPNMYCAVDALSLNYELRLTGEAKLQVVATDRAPKAIGPYSQAIKSNGLVFVSGQIPLDPSSMQLVKGDISAQAKQVLLNLSAILQESGSSLDKVLKTTVYLKDMNDFEKMNAVYAEFFSTNKPARATVEVGRLPKDVSIEIDCIAAE